MFVLDLFTYYKQSKKFPVQEVIEYDRTRFLTNVLNCNINVSVDFSNDLEGLHHSMKDTRRGKEGGVLGSKTLKEDVPLIAQPGPGPLSTTFSSRPSPVLVRT